MKRVLAVCGMGSGIPRTARHLAEAFGAMGSKVLLVDITAGTGGRSDHWPKDGFEAGHCGPASGVTIMAASLAALAEGDEALGLITRIEEAGRDHDVVIIASDADTDKRALFVAAAAQDVIVEAGVNASSIVRGAAAVHAMHEGHGADGFKVFVLGARSRKEALGSYLTLGLMAERLGSCVSLDYIGFEGRAEEDGGAAGFYLALAKGLMDDREGPLKSGVQLFWRETLPHSKGGEDGSCRVH